MDKGIYTALSGGMAKSHELELLANNLANANTPGFKRDTATFSEYLTELRKMDTPEGVAREVRAAASMDVRPQSDKSFVEVDATYTDFRQGTLERTARPLDIALDGKGFLEVLTPSGIRYTRQGNLSLSADGRIVTTLGHPVLSRPSGTGDSGEARVIRVEPAAVFITEEGMVVQNGQPVAQLSVQEFRESQWLEKVGNSYFKNTDERNIKPQENFQTRVRQGFLESSNVNPVAEMTRLIAATRAYENHLQSIRTFQEVDSKSVSDIARR